MKPMNAYRAVKSDYIAAPAIEAESASGEEAYAPHDPALKRAIGAIFDLDDQGRRLDLEVSDAPYDALVRISKELHEFGVSNNLADEFVEVIETQAVHLGVDFTKKEKPTPMTVSLRVVDEEPRLDAGKTHFMVAYDRDGRHGGEFSKTVMKLGINGTQSSHTNVPKFEDLFAAGKKQYLIVHFEKLEGEGVGALDQAGVQMATLVEAVGVAAAESRSGREIKQAIAEGSLPSDTSKLIETVAEINSVVEQTRAPDAPKDAQSRLDTLKNEVVQITDSMSRHDAAIPKALVEAVIASFDKQPVQQTPAAEAAKQAAPAKPETAPPPAANNDNIAKPVVSAPAAVEMPVQTPIAADIATPQSSAGTRTMETPAVSPATLESSPAKAAPAATTQGVETPVQSVAEAKAPQQVPNVPDTSFSQPQAKAMDAPVASVVVAPAITISAPAAPAAISDAIIVKPATSAVREASAPVAKIESPATAAPVAPPANAAPTVAAPAKPADSKVEISTPAVAKPAEVMAAATGVNEAKPVATAAREVAAQTQTAEIKSPAMVQPVVTAPANTAPAAAAPPVQPAEGKPEISRPAVAKPAEAVTAAAAVNDAKPATAEVTPVVRTAAPVTGTETQSAPVSVTQKKAVAAEQPATPTSLADVTRPAEIRTAPSETRPAQEPKGIDNVPVRAGTPETATRTPEAQPSNVPTHRADALVKEDVRSIVTERHTPATDISLKDVGGGGQDNFRRSSEPERKTSLLDTVSRVGHETNTVKSKPETNWTSEPVSLKSSTITDTIKLAKHEPTNNKTPNVLTKKFKTCCEQGCQDGDACKKMNATDRATDMDQLRAPSARPA